MKRALYGAAAVVAAAVLAVAAAGATTNLPGGTPLSVTISTPVAGVLPSGDVALTGTAAVGAAAPAANTLLLFVLDVSGSTGNPVAGAACGNQNPLRDGAANTVLDCELAAINAIRTQAIAEGTVGEIGLVIFGGSTTGTYHATDAAPADLAPAAGTTALIAPNNPSFTQPIQSVGLGTIQYFTALSVGQNTDYYAGVERALAVADSSTMANKVVVMLSDGIANIGGPGGVSATTLLPHNGITFQTFAIGPTATAPCNNTGSGSQFGTLQGIAAATGGTCHQVANPADAVTAVPDAVASKLASLATTVDGTAAGSPSATPALPQNGPATATFTQTISGLAAGEHDICVTAAGSDAGGAGTAQDCVHVTIKAPPTIALDGGDGPNGEPAGTVPEGSSFAVSATVDGSTSVAWSSDAPSHCTFADPSSASTSVTCDDNGLYALTLTANDGVNPPVSATEHLEVDNVAPTPTLTLAPGPHPLAAAVSANVAIADPGADTFTCAFDWGDGSTTTVPASGTTCADAHTYAAGGAYLVGVTVTDDDGGAGTDAQSVFVDAPPTVDAGGDTSGQEGSVIPLNGSAGDDTGAPTVAWTAFAGAGVDPGASCSFGDASAAATTITCTDDGDWTLVLTADDGVNPPQQSRITLHVANADPGLMLSATTSGQSATVTGLVSDPGSNDTQTCSFDWGDGNTDPGIAVSGGMCQATHAYASGTHAATVQVTATDDDGGATVASLPLTLNRPPACAAVAPSLTQLWPPDHGLRLIALGGATDADGDPVAYTVTGVTQDEPTNGLGDGDTSPDAVDAGAGAVWLRAERSGNGDGRVYTIAFTVSDGNGGFCDGSVRVTVPKSASKPAVLSPGPGYDSFH